MTVTDALRCPLCGAALEKKEKSLFCLGEKKRHCFDLASSGYADLSAKPGGGGDPKAAVADRTAFLNGGYYAPIADTLAELCGKYVPDDDVILDLGCGEGYYSERLAASRRGGLIGADVSKYAVDRAAKRCRARGGDNAFYTVASVYKLPVADACAGGAICVFSPIAEAEILRVLKPGGVLIVACAAPNHLLGLKKAVYDSVYLNDERADLPMNMCFAEKRRTAYDMRIDNGDDIKRLFGMTPYKFRTSAEAYERLCSLDSLLTEVEVDFLVYEKGRES